jgi:BirA family biotin operon repressor/biotin-[acetyl-CoA-carboxylase] ligase
MFDVARFHSLLATETFGRNLIFEPSVGSTMDLAREATAHGAVEGTLVAADEQTSGRGRLGRSWVNPAGVNLASTLVLRPPQAALREIALITPLALVMAIEDVAALKCGIKWPNDVVLQEQAGGGAVVQRKLAGVLIETALTEGEGAVVLVGAGVNVNWDPRVHDEIRDIATSLLAATGHEVEREALLAAYVLRFEQLYYDVKAGGSVLARWTERLVTLGQHVRASWPGGSVDGVAFDVAEDGALLVRKDTGEVVTVEAGDVTLRRDS